jgi:hypothetical protein
LLLELLHIFLSANKTPNMIHEESLKHEKKAGNMNAKFAASSTNATFK